MYKSLLAFLAVIFVCTGMAFAAHSGLSTKPRNLVVKGTLTGASSSQIDSANNACIYSSWVDRCPSGPGNCTCYVMNDPKISGSGLKGNSVTAAFITLDPGTDPATQPVVVDGGPIPECYLVLGALELTNGSGDVTVINAIGTECANVKGISKKNPAGTVNKSVVSGGWGIDSASTPPDTISGWGTFTGTVKGTNAGPGPMPIPNMPISVKLSGWITQVPQQPIQ